MDTFRPAKTELNSAERAISSMTNATTFDEFEEAWKIYLGSIEKCWIKIERVCQPKRNIFEPWQGQYKKLRKKDMLLRYIHHARNADQHTIEETVKHIPGGYALRNIQNKNFTKSLKIENGVITEYIGSPRILETFPSRIELLKFKENGNWYNPPTQHLDENLEDATQFLWRKKDLNFTTNI